MLPLTGTENTKGAFRTCLERPGPDLARDSHAGDAVLAQHEPHSPDVFVVAADETETGQLLDRGAVDLLAPCQ